MATTTSPPSYVYALHDFQPLNEDELTFKSGDKIEIIERDDEYGDGWWTGRVVGDEKAQVGLFPGSYTAAKPFASNTETNGKSTDNGAIPSIQVTHMKSPSTTMQDTLTDVQQAIEQLAHKSSNPSFSFASSDADGFSTSEAGSTDGDADLDGEDGGEQPLRSAQAGLPGGFSHHTARRRLAEKARRAVEEAEKLEGMMLSSEEGMRRRMMPVDVEISDESEGEDDHHQEVVNARRHSRIPEETEEDEEDDDLKTATLTSNFPAQTPSPPSPSSSRSLFPLPTNGDKASLPPTSPAFLPTTTEEANEADDSHSSSPPSEWTVTQVISWLKAKGFGGDVCEKFVEQEITGDVLLALDINLLKTEIGIVAFGKRMRIANAIIDLRRPPSLEYEGSFGFTGHSRSQSLVPSHNSFPGVGGGVEPSTPAYSNLSHSFSDSGPSSTANPTNHTSTTLSSSNGAEERTVLSETETTTTRAAKKEKEKEKSVRRRLFGRSHDSSHSISIKESGSRRNSGSGSTNPPSSPLPEATFFEGAEGRAISPLPQQGDPSKSTGTGARHKPRKSVDAIGLPASVSLPITSTSSSASADKDKNKDKEKAEKEKDKEKEKEKPDRLSIFGTTFGPSLGGVVGRNRKPVPRYSQLGDDAQGRGLDAAFSSSSTKEKDKERAGGSGFHLPRMGRKNGSGRPGTSEGIVVPPGEGPGLLRKRTSSHPGKDKSSAEGGAGAGGSVGGKGGGGLTSSVSEPPGGLGVASKLAALNPSINGGSLPPSASSGFTSSRGSGGSANSNSKGHDNANGNGNAKEKDKTHDKERGRDLDLSNPDFAGYLRKKGERYNTWKMRYLVLKGIDLWVLKSDKFGPGTKPKGYINLLGYKVSTLSSSQSTPTTPSNSYSFTLSHPYDTPHFFSSSSQLTTREWMKAIMKASISRDYTRPVISSCNIPTIPLVVAQAMNPAPRPPSPGQRERTQRMFLMKRERELGSVDGLAAEGEGAGASDGGSGVGRLSSRDARVLMGMPPDDPALVSSSSFGGGGGGGEQVEGRVKLDEVFGRENVRASEEEQLSLSVRHSMSSTVTPPRPSRESRRVSSGVVIAQ